MANLSVMEPLDLSSVLTPDFWFQQVRDFVKSQKKNFSLRETFLNIVINY